VSGNCGKVGENRNKALRLCLLLFDGIKNA
jgi:hypothetical protein